MATRFLVACVVIAVPRGAMAQEGNPVFAGSSDLFASAISADGSLAYIGWGAGLDVLDVSNPQAPVFLTSIGGFGGNVTAIFVSSSLVYVTSEDGGLQIIDVAAPSAPILRGSFSTPGSAEDVTVRDSLAYVADGYSGLQIIDVSNPRAPVLRGAYDTPRFAMAVALCGSLACVADSATLQIIDVSNPSGPIFRGSHPTHAVDVAVSGLLVCVADGTGLRILDVSNPSTPVALGSVYPPLNAFDRVAVSGSLAYLGTSLGFPESHSVAGLAVMDVSEPSAPARFGSYDTSGVEDVFLFDSVVYLAGGTRGVLILRSPAPGATGTPTATATFTPTSTSTPTPHGTPPPTPTPSRPAGCRLWVLDGVGQVHLLSEE